MGGGNGAAKRSVGRSQGDDRVEVLLGSDSARAAAVALGSSTVTIENEYLPACDIVSGLLTLSCRDQRQAST